MLGTAVFSILEQFALGDAPHELLRRDEEELSLECRRVLEQAIVLRNLSAAPISYHQYNTDVPCARVAPTIP